MIENPYQSPIASDLPIAELGIGPPPPLGERMATGVKVAFRWVTLIIPTTFLVLIVVGILILFVSCWRTENWTTWNRILNDASMPTVLGTAIVGPYLVTLAFCSLLAVIVSTVEHFVQKAKWKRHLNSQTSMSDSDPE